MMGMSPLMLLVLALVGYYLYKHGKLKGLGI